MNDEVAQLAAEATTYLGRYSTAMMRGVVRAEKTYTLRMKYRVLGVYIRLRLK